MAVAPMTSAEASRMQADSIFHAPATEPPQGWTWPQVPPPEPPPHASALAAAISNESRTKGLMARTVVERLAVAKGCISVVNGEAAGAARAPRGAAAAA